MRLAINTMVILVLTGAALWAADAKAGQAVYAKSCRSCHGADGVAPAAMTKMLKVEIQDLKVASKSLKDADIHKIVTEGKGKMVAVKSVTGADLDNVIAYVRALK